MNPATMHYDYIAMPDIDVPQVVDPTFQHVQATYASETNKTVSVWRAVPDFIEEANKPARRKAADQGVPGTLNRIRFNEDVKADKAT